MVQGGSRTLAWILHSFGAGVRAFTWLVVVWLQCGVGKVLAELSLMWVVRVLP